MFFHYGNNKGLKYFIERKSSNLIIVERYLPLDPVYLIFIFIQTKMTMNN